MISSTRRSPSSRSSLLFWPLTKRERVPDSGSSGALPASESSSDPSCNAKARARIAQPARDNGPPASASGISFLGPRPRSWCRRERRRSRRAKRRRRRPRSWRARTNNKDGRGRRTQAGSKQNAGSGARQLGLAALSFNAEILIACPRAIAGQAIAARPRYQVAASARPARAVTLMFQDDFVLRAASRFRRRCWRRVMGLRQQGEHEEADREARRPVPWAGALRPRVLLELLDSRTLASMFGDPARPRALCEALLVDAEAHARGCEAKSTAQVEHTRPGGARAAADVANLGAGNVERLPGEFSAASSPARSTSTKSIT